MSQHFPLINGEVKPEHSPLGASGYHRWEEEACPGSVNMSRGLDQQQSSYAAEGQKMHDIAARMLLGQKVTEILEPDDQDAIDVYVNYVNSLREGRGPADVWVKIEHRFDLSKYYPDLYGTADAVIYNYALQKLVVVDFKFGAGIPVEVENNGQLMYYGLGAMSELGLPCRSVELVIVQPRCHHKDGPVRHWTTSAARLLEFLGDLIVDAKRTADPNAPLKVGNWCRFCPAAAMKCPLVREKSLAQAKEVFSVDTPYSTERLSEALHMLPVMEAWIKRVREFAYAEAQHGRCPPGWKVVAKRATRSWKEGWSGERIAEEVGLKPPEVYDTRIKSPAQIEKLIPKSLHAAMELIVDYRSSGSALVPEDDARIGIGKSPRDVFTVIEQ